MVSEIVTLSGVALHCKIEGPENAPIVVFSNSLGTDFRIWDGVVSDLTTDYRVLRYDKRGHGLSDDPNTDWSMGELVGDLAGLMDHFDLKNAAVVGLSVGGMIAQGLAAERPDLVSLLVLSDTGVRIGNDDMWNERIATVTAKGLEVLGDDIITRWFGPSFQSDQNIAMWRNMVKRASSQGYARVCGALRDTDLLTSTARLTLPSLAIVGDRDVLTPPDIVRETANLIAGSQFEIMRGCGHLPNVEKPVEFARLLRDFFAKNGYV